VVDDGLAGVEAGVKAGIKTYYYNIYQDQCEWPGVVSFKSRSELPELIAHNKVTNFAPSVPDAAKLHRL